MCQLMAFTCIAHGLAIVNYTGFQTKCRLLPGLWARVGPLWLYLPTPWEHTATEGSGQLPEEVGCYGTVQGLLFHFIKTCQLLSSLFFLQSDSISDNGHLALHEIACLSAIIEHFPTEAQSMEELQRARVWRPS